MKKDHEQDFSTFTTICRETGKEEGIKMMILFLKGYGNTAESSSLMCILNKKDETGKYKIMS